MYKSLLEIVSSNHQDHILAFWDEISESERANLAEQIRTIDFPLINQLYQDRGAAISALPSLEQIEEPPSYKLQGESSEQGGTLKASVRITPFLAAAEGNRRLSQGRVAVIIVAGGQGTRLGFNSPKGTFPVGPISDTTLFQIHAEKTLAVSKKYGYSVPLCIMTSHITHNETVDFFEKHRYFGLAKEDVYFFSQGTMPSVSLERGKILLASKHEIALNPDGHGGILAAMNRTVFQGNASLLDVLEKRGIESLFYFQVDNPLVDICSAEMLGYHILNKSDFSSQVIRKQDPNERVGNIVSIDDRLHVIEYSDIPENVANWQNEDGSLKIWAGSIAVHVIDIAFLRRVSGNQNLLPFHCAVKKVPFVSTQEDNFGEIVASKEPNGLKFEKFFFDLLPIAKNAIIVEVDAKEHFAPLKNASGSPTDSPESVRKQISDFNILRLERAGVSVASNTTVEISPLFANSVAEIADKIPSGTLLSAADRKICLKTTM